MRKRIIFIPLGLAAGLVSLLSCKHHSETLPVSADPSTFVITSEAFDSFPPVRQSGEVLLVCDKKWTAQFQEGSWAAISKTETGERNLGVVSFDLSFNFSEEVRTDTLVIRSGTQVRKVGIEQQAITSLISIREIALQGTEETALTIHSPIRWTAEIPEDAGWLSVSPLSGDAGVSTVTVAAKEEYIDVGSRNSAVRFRFGEDVVEVQAVQRQKDVIVLSRKEYSFDYAGGLFSVTAATNVDCEIEIADSWIAGIGSKSLNQSEYTFSVAQHTGPEDRTSAVTFRSGDLAETVTVTQTGMDPILLQSNYGVYLAGGEGWTYTAGEEQISRRSLTDGTCSFRILSPAQKRAVEISGIPQQPEKGAAFTVRLLVNVEGSITKSGTYSVSALQVDSEKVWLSDADGNGFIVKIPM